ncbi:MAG: hypothetical protein ACI399_00825 [Candidatus Cryptobacteroides sp.]
MNIIVRTAGGHTTVRPDTTWEKDNEDFYPPEFVNAITASPVLFARISKPGRSVGAKFASRYYDAVNFGILLYPEDPDGLEGESYAQACCLDHTSFLPTPLFLPLTLGEEDNEFELRNNGLPFYSCTGKDATVQAIEEAIEEATKMVYIRTGDIIAVELAPRKPLVRREEGGTRVSGSWCGNPTIDFRIIF